MKSLEYTLEIYTQKQSGQKKNPKNMNQKNCEQYIDSTSGETLSKSSV